MQKTDISNSRKRAAALPAPNTAIDLPSVSVSVAGNPNSPVQSPNNVNGSLAGESSPVVLIPTQGDTLFEKQKQQEIERVIEKYPFIKRASELEGVA